MVRKSLTAYFCLFLTVFTELQLDSHCKSSKNVRNWIETLFNYSKAVINVQLVKYKVNEFVSRLEITLRALLYCITFTGTTVGSKFVKFCCYKGSNCNKKVQNFALPFDSVTFSELTKRVKQWGAISKRLRFSWAKLVLLTFLLYGTLHTTADIRMIILATLPTFIYA